MAHLYQCLSAFGDLENVDNFDNFDNFDLLEMGFDSSVFNDCCDSSSSSDKSNGGGSGGSSGSMGGEEDGLHMQTGGVSNSIDDYCGDNDDIGLDGRGDETILDESEVINDSSLTSSKRRKYKSRNDNSGSVKSTGKRKLKRDVAVSTSMMSQEQLLEASASTSKSGQHSSSQIKVGGRKVKTDPEGGGGDNNDDSEDKNAPSQPLPINYETIKEKLEHSPEYVFYAPNMLSAFNEGDLAMLQKIIKDVVTPDCHVYVKNPAGVDKDGSGHSFVLKLWEDILDHSPDGLFKITSVVKAPKDPNRKDDSKTITVVYNYTFTGTIVLLNQCSTEPKKAELKTPGALHVRFSGKKICSMHFIYSVAPTFTLIENM